MRQRNKRRRRIAIIAAGIAVLVVGGGIAYRMRQAQMDASVRTSRADGVAALGSGDYATALDGIGRYLQRCEQSGATASAEDYLLYARARSHVELPNGKHIVGAISAVRKALDLQPGYPEARKDLLDLYLQAGYGTEALELVEAMLLSTPGDIALMRRRADLLEALHRVPEALAASGEIGALPAAGIPDQFRTLRLLEASDAVPAQVDAWLAKVIAAHPNDERYQLLRASVLTRRRDTAAAKACLDRIIASSVSTSDPEFVPLLVDELDAAERFNDSLDVLDHAKTGSDETIAREVIRRLWYAGRASDLASRTELWKSELLRHDPEALALHCLSLSIAGRQEESDSIRKELEAARGPDAETWCAMIDCVRGDAAQRRRTAGALDRGVKAHARNPLLHQALGDAYACLGETDLALEAWRGAADAARAWSLPLLRIARTLSTTPGMAHLAPAIARAALVRAPNDMDAIALSVEVTAQAASVNDPKQVRALLDALNALRKDAPDRADDTLPLCVDLLARIDRQAAERDLRDVLQAAAPPTEATLLRLAQVAARAGIPLEAELLSLSEAAHGVTPPLAFATALAKARTGGDEAGLRAFDQMRGRAARAATDLDWDLARTSYLDAVGRPEAGPGWISFADGHPDALPAQLGALASRAVWTNPDAVRRIVDRVRVMTGEEGVTWRIAKARLLLSSETSSSADVAEAATTLGEVTRVAPKSVSARLLFARAFERMENLQGAEEQLRAAAELEPENSWIALELARLAQLQQRPDAARRQVERVLRSRDLVPEQIERAAYLLALQGNRRRGADVLETIAARPQASRDGLLLLAQLYAKLGDTARAVALCERLLDHPDPQVIELLAALYTAAGRGADAEAALARLDSVQLRPGERELVHARHAAAAGNKEEALNWFRRAISTAPDRDDAFAAFVKYAIATGGTAAVGEAIDACKSSTSPTLEALRSVRPLCDGVKDSERLRPLLIGIVDDAASRQVLIEAFRAAIDTSRGADGRPTSVRRLVALADANVRVLSLQIVAADASAEAGDLRKAAEIARRAETQFPNSPAAAEQAATLLMRSGNWEQALDAAIQWRDRTQRNDLRPDLVVAEALLRLGRPSEAASGLEPHVEMALRRPDEFSALLLSYAVALATSGRGARATDLLDGLVRGDASWRARALAVDPSRLGDAANAASWIRAASGTDRPSDVPTLLAECRAWGLAWQRYQTADLLAAAKAACETLTSRPDAPPESFIVAGTILQESGDTAAAEKAYRTAIDRDATLVVARNNLSMLLTDSDRWQQGVEEARKALSTSPRSGDCLDTLAYAYAKGGEYDGAREALAEAIRLEPANPIWRISMAELDAQVGNKEGIRSALGQVDAMIEQGRALPKSARDRCDRLRATLK